MYIAIVCLPGCDVVNFEIKFIFLIKRFFYMTKNSRQKSKYFENQNKFQGQKRAFFIIFKGLSVAKNYLRPDKVPLKAIICTLFCLI